MNRRCPMNPTPAYRICHRTNAHLFLLPVLCFVLISFPGNRACANEIFTINTADKAPYSTADNSGIYDVIILQIFKNLGIKTTINHLKSARSIENVDLGIDDAEYARIKGLTSRYPNIRIVDEKLLDFSFTAFAKDPSLVISSWEDLAGHSVAFIQGWKIYEMNVKETVSTVIVSSQKELFQVLLHDHVDVILYERLRGLDYMKREHIKGITALKTPLSVRGMYLYVNQRHEKIIPDLESSLREMKEKGQYRAIIDSFSR